MILDEQKQGDRMEALWEEYQQEMERAAAEHPGLDPSVYGLGVMMNLISRKVMQAEEAARDAAEARDSAIRRVKQYIPAMLYLELTRGPAPTAYKSTLKLKAYKR